VSVFDAQPHLVGELVELRPLRESDFGDLYAVAADPGIWEQHPDPTRYQEDAFRAFFSRHIASGGALLVLDRRTQAAIGTSRFHGYDSDRSEVEIGWTFLGRSYWGGAYNGELKSLMLAHAFRFVRNVVFLVSPANLRSQRAVEKIGGVRVGFRPDAGGRESILYRVALRSD
jgi:RimJ/RimL family protein N-acetyltransferase